MFGYVMINKGELKVKDYECYNAYYCGLCHELKKRYGMFGQASLSYDMTFLAILLTGLYEEAPEEKKALCLHHIGRKRRMLINKFSSYAADMNILLSYNNARDDWQDDKKLKSGISAAALKRKYKRVCEQYPRQADAVNEYMIKLSACQKEKSSNPDEASGLTGRMLSEIFVYQEDEWSDEMRRLAFYLGKFIYLMDAYEDYEKDKKSGSYNPLLFMEEDEDFEDKCLDMLNMMAAECSRAFEELPVIYEADIIRNVLYSGIWGKYDCIRESREKKKDDGSV